MRFVTPLPTRTCKVKVLETGKVITRTYTDVTDFDAHLAKIGHEFIEDVARAQAKPISTVPEAPSQWVQVEGFDEDGNRVTEMVNPEKLPAWEAKGWTKVGEAEIPTVRPIGSVKAEPRRAPPEDTAPKTLEQMSVAELQAEAGKRGVKLPDSAKTKDQILAVLTQPGAAPK